MSPLLSHPHYQSIRTFEALSRFWSEEMDDLCLSDDDSSVTALKEAFKRKAEGSPGNNDFEKCLSKKEKKKLKQLLNKSN